MICRIIKVEVRVISRAQCFDTFQAEKHGNGRIESIEKFFSALFVALPTNTTYSNNLHLGLNMQLSADCVIIAFMRMQLTNHTTHKTTALYCIIF